MACIFRWSTVFVITAVFARTLAAEEKKTTPPSIQVPDGYVVEVAAAPPLVAHPIMGNFDDRGRLFLAASAGKNLRRADLEKEVPNFVRMLEDTDGDGQFDKGTIFADKLTFPQGALWYNGALFVASSGAIWRLEDTDDDGVADKREKLVNDFGYTGNAADVHGPFLGPEGRIYWCEGRHGHEIKTADGRIISKGEAARIFSCRPDGSDVRTHCGGGMDNPTEIDFTPEGEMFGTVNILHRKRGDCLVHWLYGGVYPHSEKVITEFKRTGDLLGEVLDFGHVAVSGTTRYRGTYLGKEWQGDFFVCEFNTHKVSRVHLEREGSTYRAQRHEFLVSSSGDFHPTDVLEDADGSLLVIDTGGWFRIGCPTSQIAKPNILGAIYRIRREDGKVAEDPRGLKIDWAKIDLDKTIALLADERFAVRERALQQLASWQARDDAPDGVQLAKSVAGQAAAMDANARRRAVWALARMTTMEHQQRGDVGGHGNLIMGIVVEFLSDKDAGVRLAAANALAAVEEPLVYADFEHLFKTADAPLRRALATAMGRGGDQTSVPVLLRALGTDGDRALDHALIYALIEINDRGRTLKGFADADPRVRRGTLIALDQMDSGKLTRELVTPLLDTDDFALRQTALKLVARRPEWANDVVDVLKELIAKPANDDATRGLIRGSVIAFHTNAKMQGLVAEALANESTDVANRVLLLESMGQCGFQQLPESWREQVLDSMLSRNSSEVRQAIATVDMTGDKRFADRLIGLSNDPALPRPERLVALCTATKLGAAISFKSLRRLVGAMNPNSPPMQRLAAARAIAAARLDEGHLTFVSSAVRRAGPLELSALICAYGKNGDTRVGHQLVGALKESPGLVSLSAAQLKRVLKDYPNEVRQAAEPLFEKLRKDSAEQVERLAALEAQVSGGDPERGKEIFISKHASCAGCHQVGNLGARIGPDLSQIGARRNQRDLLEAILYPSSSLVRGYESFTFAMTDGKVHSGLITRETADAIHVRTAGQAEFRIRRDDIEELRPSDTSIMPAGLDKTMTVEQLRDLITYLRSLK